APTSMNSSLSTAMVAAGVVTGEATGDGIVRDAGEIGSATCWSSTDLELCPTSNVLRVVSSASSRARCLSVPYPKPKGSSVVVPSTGTAYCRSSYAASSLSESVLSSSKSSLSMSAMSSDVPRYLFRGGRAGDTPGGDDDGVGVSQEGDSGEVESDGEAVLVSDASMGSDSSSEYGVSGV
ncbi:hypothetical protein Tco_0912975, partial [Tanacetum coccineum]